MSRPAAVSATRRVVRSSTRTPSALSRSAIARLTAAFGTAECPGGGREPVEIDHLGEHRELRRGPDQAHGGLQSSRRVAYCFTREADAPVLQGTRIDARQRPPVPTFRKDQTHERSRCMPSRSMSSPTHSAISRRSSRRRLPTPPRASSIRRCCSARAWRPTCFRSRARCRSHATSPRIPSRGSPAGAAALRGHRDLHRASCARASRAPSTT